MMIGGYMNLIAYQKGYELVKKVYGLTKQFPKIEMFGLVAQLRQLSLSRDVGYICLEESEGVLGLNNEVKRLLISYLKRLDPV